MVLGSTGEGPREDAVIRHMQMGVLIAHLFEEPLFLFGNQVKQTGCMQAAREPHYSPGRTVNKKRCK